MQLYTDAPGSVGFGAVWGNDRFCGVWSDFSHGAPSMTIHWKEMVPIYLACATWSRRWVWKCILFRSDNCSVVDTVNWGLCRDLWAVDVVRRIAFICAVHGCAVRAKHIFGTSNPIADALSRQDMARFRRLHPAASATPSAIPAAAMNVLPPPYAVLKKLH